MKILFHICCSNCALYPVKLSREEGHDFAGFWYNPNIHPQEEYQSRLDSLKRLSDMWRVEVIYNADYKPEEYFEVIKSPNFPLQCFAATGAQPLFQRGGHTPLSPLDRGEIPPLPRGGNGGVIPPSPERCKSCYLLRLEKTAERAHEEGFDAFSTTLLISPYQDFEQIINTGRRLADKYNVDFYLKDFRQHFREALKLAKELGLYRQKYCGCIFSKQEREHGKMTNSKAQISN
ncbi:MAG: epoxyqueuosine reductase QueH [Nitrospirae bacterium]|nr:epoxyqueuosine reductase QueH [Nitrospirota bacterium]